MIVFTHTEKKEGNTWTKDGQKMIMIIIINIVKLFQRFCKIIFLLTDTLVWKGIAFRKSIYFRLLIIPVNADKTLAKFTRYEITKLS